VHRIENGDRPELSLSVITRIAHYLNVSVDWLVWGDERRSSGVMGPAGLDVPTAGFLMQIHRLPGLLAFIEGKGANIPLHVLAKGLKVLRDRPAKLVAKDGSPKEGWPAFFAEVAKQPP